MSVVVDHLKSLIDQPIAVLAARYWYRGVLAGADETGILIRNPRAVEATGPATGAVPQTEDVIPSDLLIRTEFVECICQPTWCFHEVEM